MAMAELQARARKGPVMPCYVCLLLFITTLTMTATNGPAMVVAKQQAPSTLTLYIHENRVPPNITTIIAASPSAANGGPPLGFGTIGVIDNVVRVSAAGDSPMLGYAVGQITVEKDFSLYLSYAYKLSAPGLEGTIVVQGATDPAGAGELAITGGTGLFRWARGYLELSLFSDANLADVVFKGILYLKYD